MPLVEFTQRDILRGTIVEPAWYRVHIEEIDGDGQESKDKKSINYNADATILFNGDNGDNRYKGVPVMWNFNSKALGFSKELFKAIGLNVKAGERYRLEACGGMDVDIYIENDTYQGRLVNKVNHKYRAIKPDVVEVQTDNPLNPDEAGE